jgi:TolA-binding protein
MIHVYKQNTLQFKEKLMQHHTNYSKPVILGAGAISLVALFFALGDPGKEERQQLMTALTQSQEKITQLEEKIAQQDNTSRQQQELIQLLTRKLESNEEQTVRLKTRMDDMDKTIAARLKPAAPIAAAKPKPAVTAPAAKPTPAATKPATPAAPAAQPPVKR